MRPLRLKPIPDFPGYFAGDDGFIHSTRGKKNPYARPMRRLSPAMGGTAGKYYFVGLSVNGLQKGYLVHRLIYSAWNGGLIKGLTVSHINGDKYDNRPSNLVQETQKDNLHRKYEHGTDDSGLNNSRSCLTLEQLITIRELIEAGIPATYIDQTFNLCRGFTGKLKRGESYKGQGLTI